MAQQAAPGSPQAQQASLLSNVIKQACVLDVTRALYDRFVEVMGLEKAAAGPGGAASAAAAKMVQRLGPRCCC